MKSSTRADDCKPLHLGSVRERSLAYVLEQTLQRQLVALTAHHAAALESLPEMHADPFDRLLIAQALYEPLRLMTADAELLKLGGNILPA